MQLLFRGFSQVQGFRVFVYEGVAADRTRTPFSVRTDLALIKRYGIRLQDLPLLCRTVLERCAEEEAKRDFTYTEEDMCRYAHCAAAREQAAKQKKPRRTSPGQQLGTAWRGPQR